MPVNIVTTDKEGAAKNNYLVPAPFISITKNFDKSGDGEILGTRYDLRLEGHIMATRGSPKSNGDFTDNPTDDPTEALDEDRWYASLQHKQKAISNLISKMHTGALLDVTAPIDGPSEAGFKAYVRLESVDLPTHDPGDPLKATYTINLSADYIIGPVNESSDEDDWPEKDKWLVSEATETWDIQEADQYVYDRHRINEKSIAGQEDYPSATGEEGEDNEEYYKSFGRLLQQKKLYQLTRNISAKGKNKFKRNDKPDGLSSSDRFTPVYDLNGRAWQQARGFVYDIVRYGNRFVFGPNDAEYTEGATTTDDVSIPSGNNKVYNEANGTSSSVDIETDADDYHLFGIGLPTPSNVNKSGGYSRLGPKDTYKGFNYKRLQSVDPRGGSFSVTETWMLAPRDALAIETLDIQISEDGEGQVNVTINGAIEGLADNADDYVDTEHPLGTVGNAGNSDRKIKRSGAVPEQITENFHYSGSGAGTCTVEGGYDSKESCEAAGGEWTDGSADGTVGAIRTYNSKWENAINHYKRIYPFFIGSAEGVLNDLPEYSDLKLDPHPTSKTVGEQIGTGTITYSLSFKATTKNLIPYTKRETISVNDTYPGHVVAQHTVLGRRLGPVMQNIGTQTVWQRDLTITLVVDVENEKICVDNTDHLVPQRNAAKCASSFTKGVRNRWVFNPNYVNLKGWIDDTTDSMYKVTRAKPGGPQYIAENFPDVGTVEYQEYIQGRVLGNLIDAFDPITYLHNDIESDTHHRTRKRFINPPQESWNPKTGEWSYAISWIYEVYDPWAFPSSDYVASTKELTKSDDKVHEQNDYLDHPYPGQMM